MSNRAKSASEQNGRLFLQQSFALQQQILQKKLEFSSETITHDGVMGDVNEQHFLELFRQYLPNRYEVDTGIIIDSRGQTSDQIDIVIFDQHYTPTLLDQKDHRFIPAEAVYAVLEVKPTVNKRYIEYAAGKAASVRRLHRTSVPISHAGGEYPAKPVFPIVAGILAARVDWTDGFGTSFETALAEVATIENSAIDCGLAVAGHAFDVFDGNELRRHESENALIYFLMRLLHKLQSMGTVPAIDWNAYADNLGSQIAATAEQ